MENNQNPNPQYPNQAPGFFESPFMQKCGSWICQAVCIFIWLVVPTISAGVGPFSESFNSFKLFECFDIAAVYAIVMLAMLVLPALYVIFANTGTWTKDALKIVSIIIALLPLVAAIVAPLGLGVGLGGWLYLIFGIVGAVFMWHEKLFPNVK